MLSRNGAGNELTRRFNELFRRADRLSFGALGILRHAIRRFYRVRGAEGAASVAFFTLFSFFPLLLVLVAVGGSFLESEDVQREIINMIRLTVPVDPELVVANMQEVLQERGSVGFIGLVSLIWSATGALTSLTRSIDRAWPIARPRTFIQDRSVAVGMIASLGVLLAISSITNTVLNILFQIDLPYIPDAPFWSIVTAVLPFLVALLVFFALYLWVPNTFVTRKAALWAALVAAGAWEITTNAFSWYLRSGFSQFKLIYGTVGTIVAVMFWIYLICLIIIFCAHLSAAIMHHKEYDQKEELAAEERGKVKLGQDL
jgi:membrane protein